MASRPRSAYSNHNAAAQRHLSLGNRLSKLGRSISRSVGLSQGHLTANQLRGLTTNQLLNVQPSQLKLKELNINSIYPNETNRERRKILQKLIQIKQQGNRNEITRSQRNRISKSRARVEKNKSKSKLKQKNNSKSGVFSENELQRRLNKLNE